MRIQCQSGSYLSRANMYGSKLPSQSFTTTQLEAQRTTCMSVGRISQRGLLHHRDTYTTSRGPSI